MPKPSHPADHVVRLGHALSIGCGGLFGAAWVLFWSAATLSFDALCVRGIAQQSRATSFPTTRGTVVSSEVKTHIGSKGSRSYTPAVKYAYTVGHVRHEGDQLRYGMKTSGREYAGRLVADHPPGREVTVYYDPASPASAILQPGVDGTDLFMILFLVPFNVVMLGGWFFGYHVLRRLGDPAARFMRRVRHQGTRPVIRLPGVTPLAAAAGAALGTSFILVFVVGFSSGMQPSTTAVTLALAVVGAAALLAGASVARPGHLARRELTVDPLRRTLTLPPAAPHAPPETVAFNQVTGVSVERKVTTGAKRSTTRFVPTLRLAPAPGQRREIPLGQFDDEPEANAMRDWLADQLGLTAPAAASAAGRTSPAGT